MKSAADTIAAYLRAKDENRPYLMRDAFAEDAALAMVVKSDNIAFPAATRGREAIANVIVRDFSTAYENVRTLCLTPAPIGTPHAFSCPWLVGMSVKADGAVRVGWGRYDWTFDADTARVRRLTITIEVMHVLPPRCLDVVVGWTFALPYPWCSAERAVLTLPELEVLQPLRDYLRSSI
jgi:hypothetical protein